MCCRGWLKDSDPLPISEAPVENQHLVDIRVTSSFADLDAFLSEINTNLQNIFLSLPLLRKRNDWVVINSIDKGKTIKERLEILKKGEDHGDHNSCMRLTSNYLAQSVYRYMQILELEPPFHLEDLRDIS